MKHFKIKNEPLLKLILQIDAVFGLLLAVIGLGFTSSVATAFGLPFTYILPTTLIIATYSSYTWILTKAPQLEPKKVYLLFIINAVWTVKAGIFLGFYYQVATSLGLAFLISELMVVLGFALLQRWQLGTD